MIVTTLRPWFVVESSDLLTRKFFMDTIKMLNKFAFGDSLMKDLPIFQPEEAPKYPVQGVLFLARPQLGLADDILLDKL